MNTPYRRPLGVAALVSRWIVGATLLVSGYSKVAAPPEELAAVMDGYQILPIQIIMPLARALPWIELSIGTCLFLGIFLRRVSAMAVVIFAVFVSALGSVLARGIDMESCGCFGKWGPTLKPSQTILLDVGFLLLTALISLDREKFLSIDRWRRRRRGASA